MTEDCMKCKGALNSINGRYCLWAKAYVTYDVVTRCKGGVTTKEEDIT